MNLGPAKNDPSPFNLITTDLELDNQRISSHVIDIDGYGVDVDGSGSVSGLMSWAIVDWRRLQPRRASSPTPSPGCPGPQVSAAGR
jgi:hypothetical protein